MDLLTIDNYITSRYISKLSDEERKQHINEIYLDLTRVFTPDSLEELRGEEVTTQAGINSFTMPVAARKVGAVFVDEEQDGYVVEDYTMINKLITSQISLLILLGDMGIKVTEATLIYDLNEDTFFDISDAVLIDKKLANKTRKRLRQVNKNAITYPQQRGAGYNAETETFFKRVGTDNIMLKPKRWAINRTTQLEGKNRIELIFDPIPRGSIPLHIFYEPMPAFLSENADIPQYVPEEYHYLIAWGTIAILASQPGTEDWNVAQAWEARFRSGVNEMIQALGLTAPDNYPNIAMIVRREEGVAKNV